MHTCGHLGWTCCHSLVVQSTVLPTLASTGTLGSGYLAKLTVGGKICKADPMEKSRTCSFERQNATQASLWV